MHIENLVMNCFDDFFNSSSAKDFFVLYTELDIDSMLG